jgi:hypothetical protein
MVADDGSEAIASELADLLDGAPRVPLLRDRVRVDRREVDRRLERLAEAVRSEVADHRLEKIVGYDLLQAAEAVRRARRHADPIPLTDQVRLPRSQAFEMARALRVASQPWRNRDIGAEASCRSRTNSSSPNPDRLRDVDARRSETAPSG